MSRPLDQPAQPHERVFLALGSNLSDPPAQIKRAIAQLRQHDDIQVIAVAALRRNPAVDSPPDAPDFVNTAAEVVTTLSPIELLRVLQSIELSAGRVRSERNAPRTIDLDIVLYGDRVIDEPELNVPHPRMHQRAFVLEPLAEIAGEVRHPTLNTDIATLYSRFSS